MFCSHNSLQNRTIVQTTKNSISTSLLIPQQPPQSRASSLFSSILLHSYTYVLIFVHWSKNIKFKRRKTHEYSILVLIVYHDFIIIYTAIQNITIVQIHICNLETYYLLCSLRFVLQRNFHFPSKSWNQIQMRLIPYPSVMTGNRLNQFPYSFHQLRGHLLRRSPLLLR